MNWGSMGIENKVHCLAMCTHGFLTSPWSWMTLTLTMLEQLPLWCRGTCSSCIQVFRGAARDWVCVTNCACRRSPLPTAAQAGTVRVTTRQSPSPPQVAIHDAKQDQEQQLVTHYTHARLGLSSLHASCCARNFRQCTTAQLQLRLRLQLQP